MGLRERGVVVPLERYWQYWSAKLIPAVLEGNRQVATKVGIPLKTRPQSIATLESCCTRANVRRIGNTGSRPQSQASKLHREGSLLPRQGVGMEASQLSERGLNATVPLYHYPLITIATMRIPHPILPHGPCLFTSKSFTIFSHRWVLMNIRCPTVPC